MPSTSGDPQHDDAECVNWRIALATVGGHRHILRGMVEASLEENPRLLVDLRAALAGGAADAVLFNAHTLKGALDYLGARRAADLAGQLEVLGHDQTLTEAPPLLAALEQEFERVQAELARYLADDANEKNH